MNIQVFVVLRHPGIVDAELDSFIDVVGISLFLDRLWHLQFGNDLLRCGLLHLGLVLMLGDVDLRL